MDSVRPEDVGFSSARLQRIDDTLQRFVNAGKIAGAVSLIARHGKVAHFAATGLLDREARRAMERDAIFRIASMTKLITVTATLMLFEEGHFLLDDPIADFLPEFAQTKVFVQETASGIDVADLDRPITIRHLLTHTSGLTYDFWPDDPVSRIYARERFWGPEVPLVEVVRRLAAQPLAHQPGARFTYGFSHDVLGRLIEVISGQSLDTFLQERVFNPLEMVDTGFAVPKSASGRLAVVYASDGRGGLERDLTAGDRSTLPAFLSGGGGLVSTAADYARFCQMLVNGGGLGNERLLGRKTVELLAANQWPEDKCPFPPGSSELGGNGFGLGVRTLTNVAQSGIPSSVGEYGWSGAYGTYCWIDPREQMIGILMIQLTPFNLRTGWIFKVVAYQALVD
jgi:CubicO group peptidase (beta-lactamase class C family)